MRRLLDGLYYLLLGAWFGAMLMLAISAAATFGQLRLHRDWIAAPADFSPQAAAHAAEHLAGNVVGHALASLAVLQGVCGGAALVLALIQSARTPRTASPGKGLRLANAARITLIFLPLTLLAADRLAVTPRIAEARAVVRGAAVDAPARAAAKQRFDAAHHLSVRLMGASMLSVAAAILLSPLVLSSTPASKPQP